jgi:hypothetical protein
MSEWDWERDERIAAQHDADPGDTDYHRSSCTCRACAAENADPTPVRRR